MIELNLPIIATAIGIVVSLWKFASSIAKFAHAVDDLKGSMGASQKDRALLHVRINDVEKETNGRLGAIENTVTRIDTQYNDIREDLKEIKQKVS